VLIWGGGSWSNAEIARCQGSNFQTRHGQGDSFHSGKTRADARVFFRVTACPPQGSVGLKRPINGGFSGLVILPSGLRRGNNLGPEIAQWQRFSGVADPCTMLAPACRPIHPRC